MARHPDGETPLDPPTPAEWRSAMLSTVEDDEGASDETATHLNADQQAEPAVTASPADAPGPLYLTSAYGVALAHGAPIEPFLAADRSSREE